MRASETSRNLRPIGRTPRAADPVDALRAQAAVLVGMIAGGVSEIETPQLGRVVYSSVTDLIAALNLINGMIAASQGGPSRTQAVIAVRGLWPRSMETGGLWQ